MASHVRFPVELLDMAKLEEFFAGIEMKPDKFFDNRVELGRWWMKNSFEKLREKVNKTDWKSHANSAVVNAYYNGVTNAIILPAGILQVHCVTFATGSRVLHIHNSLNQLRLPHVVKALFRTSLLVANEINKNRQIETFRGRSLEEIVQSI